MKILKMSYSLLLYMYKAPRYMYVKHYILCEEKSEKIAEERGRKTEIKQKKMRTKEKKKKKGIHTNLTKSYMK